jgi:hypothetical protein
VTPPTIIIIDPPKNDTNETHPDPIPGSPNVTCDALLVDECRFVNFFLFSISVSVTLSFCRTGQSRIIVGDNSTLQFVIRIPDGSTINNTVIAVPVPVYLHIKASRILWIGRRLTLNAHVGDSGTVVDTNRDGHKDTVLFNLGTIINTRALSANMQDEIVVEVTVWVPFSTVATVVDLRPFVTHEGGQCTAPASATVFSVKPHLLLNSRILNVTLPDKKSTTKRTIVHFGVQVKHDKQSSQSIFLTLSQELPDAFELIPSSLSLNRRVTQITTSGNEYEIKLNQLDVKQDLVVKFDAYVVDRSVLEEDSVFPAAHLVYSHWAQPTCLYDEDSDVVLEKEQFCNSCPECVDLTERHVAFVKFVQKRRSKIIGPTPPMPCF